MSDVGQGQQGPIGITVTGSGRVSIEPDIAVLQVGASLSETDLQQARDAAAEKLGAAREVLLAAGVAQGDLKTSRLDVHTSYDRSDDRRLHHLSVELEAVVRDPSTAQSIVDDLFAAIGDGMEMRSLTFAVDDPSVGRDEAMALAFDDARSKAVELARLAGVRLGPVLAISESEPAFGGPVPMMRSAMAATSAEIPIETGSLDQQVTIGVRWAIES